ncbi:DUF3782 domain-containing protein [Pyrodictium occultum]|uniref:DUF3782 domain-containing protein n=1 Tax=Pyrodictium occultum TaxID=2309 RepID=UPI0014436A2F|nr:DUF3782 domain-containing protein [Pyrodictium occultum]
MLGREEGGSLEPSRGREPRYALMGLLGYKEILDKITRLEKRLAELYEMRQKLEERLARLEERFLELGERQEGLEREMAETRSVPAAIAHRPGVISEESFGEAMRHVMEGLPARRECPGGGLDSEGLVYGRLAVVEAEVVVRDGAHTGGGQALGEWERRSGDLLVTLGGPGGSGGQGARRKAGRGDQACSRERWEPLHYNHGGRQAPSTAPGTAWRARGEDRGKMVGAAAGI